MGPSSPGECHACVKKATDSEQALTTASASQICARLTSFPSPTPCWVLCGPFIHSDYGFWVSRSTGRHTSADLDQRTRQDEGHWLFTLPFFVLSPVPDFPTAKARLFYVEEMTQMWYFWKDISGHTGAPQGLGKAAYYIPFDVSMHIYILKTTESCSQMTWRACLCLSLWFPVRPALWWCAGHSVDSPGPTHPLKKVQMQPGE